MLLTLGLMDLLRIQMQHHLPETLCTLTSTLADSLCVDALPVDPNSRVGAT